MWRCVASVVVPLSLPFLLLAAGRLPAAESPLIPDSAAARHGLIRPWFAQAALDPGRSRLSHLRLYDGTLYVQSNRGLLQALDAETGAVQWTRQVGRPDEATMPLGVGKLFVAVVCGSRLYVVNRHNGELLQVEDLDRAAGSGPAVGDRWIYVPLLTGMVVAYHLEQRSSPGDEGLANKKRADERARQRAAAAEGGPAVPPETSLAEFPALSSEQLDHLQLRPEVLAPLRRQSKGRALVPPLVLREDGFEEYVAWPTDAGRLYIGRINREKADSLEVRYCLETAAPISVPAAYVPPDPQIDLHWGTVIAASQDGSLTAMHEQNGKLLWRSSLGEPIVMPLAVIGDRVYAATQFGGLHCLDVKTGKERWNAPQAFQFVAQSKNRVYAANRPGQLLILDAATGATLDRLDGAASPLKLSNTLNDRIYLASSGGLIQCLHESEQAEPINYTPVPPTEKKPAAAPAKSAPASAGPAEEDENPFEEQ
ncbi:MAG: PQQ-binding-like beta-propeller repeat protein [Pirellulales bacterium]|nr:PQQ-binding-like beta-propeller repeat protein [Pirellulales bacterium]